jgi:hypothetical protein
MGTTGPKSVDELARQVAARHEDAQPIGDQQSITAMLHTLRELGAQQVTQALWPSCLLLLDADAVKDVTTRYQVYDQPITHIVADTGISEALVRVVLEQADIPLRRRGHRHTWTPEEIAELQRRHRGGETLEQIAAGLDLPLNTVSRKHDQLLQLGLLSNPAVTP